MEERYKSRVAVFLLLIRKNPNNASKDQILLQKRQNTGYMDGMYDAGASGHLDDNESILEAMIRESKEEIGIDLNKDDLKLVTLYHGSKKFNVTGYLRFYFLANKWKNEPKICEPEKCSQIGWFDLDNLPNDIIPHFKKTISNYINGKLYDQDEF